MESKKQITLLLAEDDQNLSMLLKDFLEMIGYKVVLCRDGNEGLILFKNRDIDLCILDIMMPVKDGFTLAEEIKKLNHDTPIIFLSAKTLQEDRVKGFKMGCDDYITKPFSTEELKLRIEAILRRCKIQEQLIKEDQKQIVEIGGYSFDPFNMILTYGETSTSLTKKESELLYLLSKNKNSLLKREDALNAIWGTDDYFIGRSMDVFIAKLRKHLKNDPSVSINNVHGVGFRLDVAE